MKDYSHTLEVKSESFRVARSSIASAAMKARLIDQETGLVIGDGEFIPIERYWSDDDQRNFPSVRPNLTYGEMLAWYNGTLWAFQPEHLRAWN